MRRPELVERLTGAHDASLAVIVAPPGYGKSTLVSEWAERDQRTFFWIGFDESERRGSALTARMIVQAFGAAGWIDADTTAVLTALACDGVTEMIPELMRCIAERQHDFVLVLDDGHLAAPATLRRTVEAVLKELPGESMVAVVSRTEPNLAIGRLRAHRRLVEVRMADLAMGLAEAATLLRRAGLELDEHEVAALVAHTEGWPAALYLAGVSLRDRSEPASGRARFRGDDHLLAEYLRDDVLASVPADLTSFLLRSSVLGELSGTVCDEVLGERGSARSLAQLAGLNQLLMPLDAAHESFRWQRLFGEALRTEFRRQEPELELELQIRASAWFAGRGEFESAIGHAVAARDSRRTAELLLDNVVPLLAQGRDGLVRGWLDTLGPERIAACPSLALCAAYGALMGGDFEQGQAWAVAAAETPERRRAQARSVGMVALDALTARAGAGQMRAEISRAYDVEPIQSSWRPLLCLLRGVSEQLTGDGAAARRRLREGVDLGAGPAPLLAALCLAVETMIALEVKEWDTATELADEARTMLDERELATQPLSALVFAACAAAGAHAGRADEAKRDLRAGTELLTELGDFIPWYGAEARILLAHSSLWLADIVGARTLLAEASRLARRVPDAVIFQRWFDEAWAYMDTLAEASLSGPSSLTIAELRILRFLPSHRSFREIALQLGVSANTVKTQAHAVYRKLGAASRSEAVARATEAGLLGQ